ncbi:hypothetical protein [Methylacidimicrobium sp. AP8]|uniref:hypothetical protein n=1 Tax=Methylacidimicrobium sp. AP8 TaxID=2730359 RepID=UPI0019247C6B|nr:hypothetical protein [Methylacidimicrobium sp. AP8]
MGDPTPTPAFSQRASPPAGPSPQWDIAFVAKPTAEPNQPVGQAPAAGRDAEAHADAATNPPQPPLSVPAEARSEPAPSEISGPSRPPDTAGLASQAREFIGGFAHGVGDELKDTAASIAQLSTIAQKIATDAHYRQQAWQAAWNGARAAVQFAKTAVTHPGEAAHQIASTAGAAWNAFQDDYQREGAAALGRAFGHAVVIAATSFIPGGGEAAAAAKAIRAAEGLGKAAIAAEELAKAATTENLIKANAELLAKRYHWARPDTLYDHWVDHGADFGAKSPEEYARMAQQFFHRSQVEGLPSKIDKKGVIRVYDPASNTFGAYNADGTTKTFYKPRARRAYFDRQDGVSPVTVGGP